MNIQEQELLLPVKATKYLNKKKSKQTLSLCLIGKKKPQQYYGC